MDRLEALLSCAQPSACLAAPPCSELSPQQHHQQQTRPPGANTPAAAHHRASAPYHHPLSPPIITGQAPAGLAGPSRAGATAAQDYGTSLGLRGSPPGRTALPPLASLANGPGSFDSGPPAPGPMPSSRSSSSLHHRDRDRDRESREHASEQQHRHGELVHHQPYAPPPPPQLQQPLQPPHQQTKNSRAQTLTPLGERLRLLTTPQGPAAAVLRLCHHPNFFCSNSSRPRNSSKRRRRLLARAAQVRCTAIEIIMPVYRRHRRLFLVRQRNSGVQSVRSGSGSAAIPTHTNASPTGTSSSKMRRGRRALCR